MKAPEHLETSRLILRRPQARDAESIFARYAGDREVTRLMGWPMHATVEDTRAFLRFSDDEWERWPAGPYLVCARADGTLLGSTGLVFETPSRASTGYILARDAWGHGYATEALGAVVTTAPSLGLFRLQAVCHVDHHASARVLEKCRFVREGTLRRYMAFPNLAADEPADVHFYARTW